MSKRERRRQSSALPEPTSRPTTDLELFGEENTVKPGTREEASIIDQSIFGTFSGVPAKELEKRVEELEAQLAEVDHKPGARFQISPVGVQFDENVSAEDIKQFLADVHNVESATHWMYGDALAFGEHRKWGEIYDWAVEITGKSKQTLENYAWVSRTFPNISERSEILKYKHYELLAGIEDSVKRYRVMHNAIDGRWSTRRLKSEIEGLALPSAFDQERTRLFNRRDKLIKMAFSKEVPREEMRALLRDEILFLEKLMRQIAEDD